MDDLYSMRKAVVNRFPARFRGANLEALDKELFGAVLTYYEDYPKKITSGEGILLCGNVGCGKTWALTALTFAVAAAKKWSLKCEFVTAEDMFNRVRPVNPEGYDEYRDKPWIHTYKTVPWLVIDDLGKEYKAGGFQDQVIHSLGDVIRTRAQNCLVTHITTNLSLKPGMGSSATVRETYGGSIASLLTECVQAVTVVGPDRRKLSGV